MKIPAIVVFLIVLLSVPLFGQNRASASFPHEKAKHRTIQCSACHRVSAAKPDVTRFPGHATCINCHEFAKEAVEKPVAFCGICHSGTPVSATQPALFRFPKRKGISDFGIDFSHVSHMKPLPPAVLHASFKTRKDNSLMCQECHRFEKTKATTKPEMPLTNAHANCFRCHSEKPAHAPSMNQCAGCHKLDVAQPPHMFNVIPGFRHNDHRIDIRPKKKRDVAALKQIDLCTDCHASVARAENLKELRLPEESYCVQCHNGRIGLPEVLSEAVLTRLRKDR